jgi:hypothetical protein
MSLKFHVIGPPLPSGLCTGARLPAAFAAARFFGAAAFARFFVLAAFFATFLRPAFIPLSLPERAHV